MVSHCIDVITLKDFRGSDNFELGPADIVRYLVYEVDGDRTGAETDQQTDLKYLDWLELFLNEGIFYIVANQLEGVVVLAPVVAAEFVGANWDYKGEGYNVAEVKIVLFFVDDPVKHVVDEEYLVFEAFYIEFLVDYPTT